MAGGSKGAARLPNIGCWNNFRGSLGSQMLAPVLGQGNRAPAFRMMLIRTNKPPQTKVHLSSHPFTHPCPPSLNGLAAAAAAHKFPECETCRRRPGSQPTNLQNASTALDSAENLSMSTKNAIHRSPECECWALF